MSDFLNRLWRVGLRVAWLLGRIWFQLAAPNLRAAATIVVWDGRILVLEHSYKKDPGLPGGVLKRAEEPILGAIRELREEVGLEPKPEELQGRGFVTEKLGRANVTMHLFEWRPERQPDVTIDEREIIAAHFVTREELGRRLPRLKPTLDQLAEPGIW